MEKLIVGGAYNKTTKNKLSELVSDNHKKYIVLAHGQDKESEFTIPKGSAVIFVSPRYAFLEKNYAVRSLATNLFKNKAMIKKFLSFKLPNSMYKTPMGANKHAVQIFVEGNTSPDLEFTFKNIQYNNLIGIWNLPVTNGSRPRKPTLNKLSEIMNRQKGVYFVFACRGVCSRTNMRQWTQLAGTIGKVVSYVPKQERIPEGATSLSRVNKLRRALPKLSTKQRTSNSTSRNTITPTTEMNNNNSNSNSEISPKRMTIIPPRKPASKKLTLKIPRGVRGAPRRRLDIGTKKKSSIPKPKGVTKKKSPTRKPGGVTKKKSRARQTKKERILRLYKALLKIQKEPPTAARYNKIMSILQKIRKLNGSSAGVGRFNIPSFVG